MLSVQEIADIFPESSKCDAFIDEFSTFAMRSLVLIHDQKKADRLAVQEKAETVSDI